MKLTSKCKKEFEKWLSKTKWKDTASKNNFYLAFNDLPDSMQWGVYVDFFDFKNIIIEIEADYYDGWNFGAIITDIEGDYILVPMESTRVKARTAAIEKANKIYNNTTLD